MKKANLFQKKKEATKTLVNERELRTAERSRTNLLEETILIDEEFSIIRDFKDDDIKVVNMNKTKNNFYNENAIDLEKELLQEMTPKKKPRVWRFLVFGILAVLIVVMIIVIVIKL
ncbi:hypothetical protein S100390_v1c08400 [Spiroplasma sp. NBRC 100390]|uniref:hypothetical protein n=1 Tax=unclassified Spiroplasma TaxID=2637901 RepID=UPI00089281BB|nr:MULTISPECIES: hypothetical protein [unclassified Spiroplasma]AOX44176.1 hypothetical protein STU14_v1c08400 [Spiroplasma sp. TU-14]APE13646.1 hypothetical protein S100390_v1c08400 [Spiroplasma sp. NBRC 100390]